MSNRITIIINDQVAQVRLNRANQRIALGRQRGEDIEFRKAGKW